MTELPPWPSVDAFVALSKLDMDERDVLLDHYLLGSSFSELARDYGSKIIERVLRCELPGDEIPRAMPDDGIPHGTLNGYRGRRPSDPRKKRAGCRCDRCKGANAAYIAECRARPKWGRK